VAVVEKFPAAGKPATGGLIVTSHVFRPPESAANMMKLSKQTKQFLGKTPLPMDLLAFANAAKQAMPKPRMKGHSHRHPKPK